MLFQDNRLQLWEAHLFISLSPGPHSTVYAISSKRTSNFPFSAGSTTNLRIWFPLKSSKFIPSWKTVSQKRKLYLDIFLLEISSDHFSVGNFQSFIEPSKHWRSWEEKEIYFCRKNLTDAPEPQDQSFNPMKWNSKIYYANTSPTLFS